MPIPNDHKERLLDAFKHHDLVFAMDYITLNDRDEVITFVVAESYKARDDGRLDDANQMLLTLTHAQVNPIETITEAFNQGVQSVT